MNRFDHLHKQYREKKMKERKERLLASSRNTIDTNGGGTSGYRFKHGPRVGHVAGHITVPAKNKI